MYLLDIECEYSIHSTLQEVAERIEGFVDYDISDPFQSVSKLPTVHKQSNSPALEELSFGEYMELENLVRGMITENIKESEAWQQHMKLENMK